MTLSMILILILSCTCWYLLIKYVIKAYRFFVPNKKSKKNYRSIVNMSTKQKTYSDPEQNPDFYKVLAHEINRNGDVIYNGSVGYGFIATENDVFLIKETPSGRDEVLIGSLNYVYHTVPNSLDANRIVRDIVANFYRSYPTLKKNYHGYI